MYLHARWYDPTIGRFLSPDDRLGRLSMPQDQNRYAYVVNNPMAYTDPTGHDFWSDLFNILAVVALVLTVAALVIATAGLAGFALGVVTELEFTALAADMGMALAVGIGSAIGSAIGAAYVGDDPLEAAVQGFVWGFGPAAGAAAIGWVVRLAEGGIVGSVPKAAAKEQRAPQAAADAKAALDPVRPEARAIGQGHAFDKHVLERKEFRDLKITTPEEFSEHISRVMEGAKGTNVKSLSDGRMAYWDDATQTVVIVNPMDPDLGTAFRPPKLGRTYYESLT